MADPERAILETGNAIKQLLRDTGVRLRELADGWENAHRFPLEGEPASHESAIKFLDGRNELMEALDKLRQAYALSEEATSSIRSNLRP